MCFFNPIPFLPLTLTKNYNLLGEYEQHYIPRQLSPDVLSALQGVRFIAQHIKDADKDVEVIDSDFI